MTIAGVLTIFSVITVVLVILSFQKRSSRLRSSATGLLVSSLTIALLLAAAEGYLRFFYADTAGRMASNNWQDRHWQTNSLGYRDWEWTTFTPSDDVITIGVIGDSFAAGWGVDDPADRFPDRLGALLGDGYRVFNISLPGTSTHDHLTMLDDFNALGIAQLDILIWQYYLNDIDYAVLTQGLPIPGRAISPLARESHLVDYVELRLGGGMWDDYWTTTYGYYDHAPIWGIHADQIEALSAQMQAISPRVIGVIFPNMLDPFGSIAYVDRVAQQMRASGIDEVLPLFDMAEVFPLDARIVSPFDAHASASFHRVVADVLYRDYFGGDPD